MITVKASDILNSVALEGVVIEYNERPLSSPTINSSGRTMYMAYMLSDRGVCSIITTKNYGVFTIELHDEYVQTDHNRMLVWDEEAITRLENWKYVVKEEDIAEFALKIKKPNVVLTNLKPTEVNICEAARLALNAQYNLNIPELGDREACDEGLEAYGFDSGQLSVCLDKCQIELYLFLPGEGNVVHNYTFALGDIVKTYDNRRHLISPGQE